MIKKCIVCDREFELKYAAQKTCSNMCMRIHRAEKNREWRNNSKKNEKYRKCPACGKQFDKQGNKQFCSVACRARLANQRYAKSKNKPRVVDYLTKEEDALFFEDIERKQEYRKGDPQALDRWTKEAKDIGVSLTEYRTAKDTMKPERFEKWKETKRKEILRVDFLKKSGQINEVIRK